MAFVTPPSLLTPRVGICAGVRVCVGRRTGCPSLCLELVAVVVGTQNVPQNPWEGGSEPSLVVLGNGRSPNHCGP